MGCQRRCTSSRLEMPCVLVSLWIDTSAFSTRIKDAGIAIRHSRGRILFYTAVSRNWLKGVGIGWHQTQKGSCTQDKYTFFVIEKYVEDVKHDEKHVPDLLEAIMRPTCLVKEALRRNLMNMCQFRSKITKIRVSTFGCRKSDGFPPEANTTSENSKF